MPLEQDPIISINNFKKRYKKALSRKGLERLQAVNRLAAKHNIALGAQSDKVIDLVGNHLEQSFRESASEDVAAFIYALAIEQMDRETDENRRMYGNQSRYDRKYIHQRSLRDQLQDHDMTRLLPKSDGHIEVLGPVNRFDSSSIGAAQEGINLALQQQRYKHIFIPIGPGHWRGAYLSKPGDGTGQYQLELFDPYGPRGANAIRHMTLGLLKQCGINERQISITLTGPIKPQQDGYACGDFTCAYSHKKMQELDAPSTACNQELINVLDTHGNRDDLLRHATRGVSETLTNTGTSKQKSGKILKQKENMDFTATEKRNFLSRLVNKFLDPQELDKAVFSQHVATIKTPSANTSAASLRELDAYGVFHPDGSLNEAVAKQFEIIFDSGRIKSRLESLGFKHLSFREMIVFEAAIATVIHELASESFEKVMTLQDELKTLLQKHDPKSQTRKAAIEVELEDINSHQRGNGLARKSLSELGSPKQLRLTTPLSMELSDPARQRMGMGYFKFKKTNISISPGPNSAQSHTPAEHAKYHETQHNIATYLNHLLSNHVAHVFAMGRILPYHPQDGGNNRAIIKNKIVANDFINYFIPDADGHVRLPEMSELKDVQISSRPIRKVGRCLTYEISINGNAPIHIHHFPIRDKQPLDLTTQELAYVKQIGQTTSSEQVIHTHARYGKGRSAQMAYLLASFNPHDIQLSPQQRLMQMRAEKTGGQEKAFIETPLQEAYIQDAERLIHEDSVGESALEDDNIELYFIYATLLKQEIDKHLRQIGLPKQKLIKPEHQALLELMEHYQELSSIPSHQLQEHITTICDKHLIVTESTRTLLTNINHSLKNAKDLNEIRKILLNNDVDNNIADLINTIFVSIVDSQGELTKDTFERLKNEYYQCRQRLELLDKAKYQDDVQVLDEALITRSKLIEQLFILGYDHFEIEPTAISIKMELLYQRLSALHAANELSPARWDELKKQFTALKTIFDYQKPADMELPEIGITLTTLFRGKREDTIPLLTWDVLQVEPKSERLDEFVAGLKEVVAEAVFTKFPKAYYGDKAKGAYSKEINQLLVAIDRLAKQYRKPPENRAKSQNSTLPVLEEYEKARQQVIELISKHVPFLMIQNTLRVQLENLNKDVQRLRHHFQLRTPEFKALKKRFAELKKAYQSSNAQRDNPLIHQLIDTVETQIKAVVDPDEEERKRLALTRKKHLLSMENIRNIQAIKSANARAIQDDINDVDLPVKAPSPYQQPKLIVLDADALINLEGKAVEKVFNILKYAKVKGIEVALTSRRTPAQDAEEKTPIAKLKWDIYSQTGINIADMLVFLNTDSRRREKQARVNYFHETIAKLEQEIKGLKEPRSHAANQDEIENNIKVLQLEVDALQKQAARLTTDQFMQLDAAKRHYRALKNPNSYYQIVEGGVLLDFRNPQLTNNIGIADFNEKSTIWTALFNAAEALMRAPELQDKISKPSLHTIFKDLIFDADKPERLDKKYGNLRQWEQVIKHVAEHQNYLSDHIAQIESFYQSRLVKQKIDYERIAALHEQEVVYVDAQEDIVQQIQQQSDYRPLKMAEGEDSLQFTLDFNDEIGAYHDLIAYLNDASSHIPRNYDPRRSNIPNFQTQEFRHTPIVLHVAMSKIMKKLPELIQDQKDLICFKQQLIDAAITRFNELSKTLQQDFVKSYYADAHQALTTINKQLKALVAHPEKSPQLSDELIKLEEQANNMIELDAKFSQHISPTFLSCEAKLCKLMIQQAQRAGNLDHLKIKAEKVQLHEKQEETRKTLYIESIKDKPDIYRRAIHPALAAVDSCDQALIAARYACYVADFLQDKIDVYIQTIDPLAQVMEGKDPSLQALIDNLEAYVRDMSAKKTHDTPLTKVRRQLIAAQALCQDLQDIAPLQNRVEHFKKQAGGDYAGQLNALSQRMIGCRKKIENSAEYQAECFLDKADKYLRTKNWQVGFQWHQHTVSVNGVVKKIPTTVAAQLDVIKKARENNNYVDAKQEFLRLGQQKELTWRSSKIAKNYYSLFKKKDVNLEKELESVFVPGKKT